MIQRGGNRNFRYIPNARNTPDVSVPPQGIINTMLPVPLEIGGAPAANVDPGVPQQPLPISALASALASAPPDQQRAVRYTFFTLKSNLKSLPPFYRTNLVLLQMFEASLLLVLLRCLVSSFTHWWISWSMILLVR